MKWEDLLTDRSQTVAEQAAIQQNRLIAIRNTNRQEIVDRFDKEAHRLEQIALFQGVFFVDDSMACSVNATYYSFETINNPIIWLAGGNDENTNYLELIGPVSQKVKMLICIGQDNEKLAAAFFGYVPEIRACKNMEDAVQAAFNAAEKRDMVLLSPACECDELYPDYQSRGDTFKKAVIKL
ncbi:MAG: hypothetical protein LBH82_05715 [Bacteroidales bacterium]|jgi:UDP-N-acetylmuramoylalanine--D-glutamate ligase|nr:hypothetical protein [Bacteroidales bacterium]